MSNEPGRLSPRQQAVLGVAISLASLAVAFGACGVGSSQRLPLVIQCQIDALKILPKDPAMATPYDAVDIINRIKECKRLGADAGS